jgi:hypothetical protein
VCLFFVPGHGAHHEEAGNAARARAGLLNLVAMWAFTFQLMSYVQVTDDTIDATVKWQLWGWFDNVFLGVAISMAVEFALASVFGLGCSPVGIIGIALATKNPLYKQEPGWSPSRPKRFAWFIGFFMVMICVVVLTTVSDYKVQKPAIMTVALICVITTYMEASWGFCAGCWMWGLAFPDKCKQCSEQPTVV